MEYIKNKKINLDFCTNLSRTDNKSMDFNPAIAGYSAAIDAGLDENPDYF